MGSDFFSISGRELGKEEIAHLEKEAKHLKNELGGSIKKNRISAEVFIGGSLAKKTLVKEEVNYIDIFVRFAKKYTGADISALLCKIIERSKIDGRIAKVHGSRDYFRISGKKALFEVIPVLKISKGKEAQNVTDLSYFHVNYVKRKLKAGINPREIVKAKAFCKSAGVYGAEGYIRGFSGYGLECLIINYGSFGKMLKAIVRAKGKIILDPEKFYKSEEQLIMELNENKLKSPIVLVDPTWKERNVLAALSNESLEKFKTYAKAFLKKPSPKFFDSKKKDSTEIFKVAKKNKAEFGEIVVSTTKQEGDIAGSKLRKFYDTFMEDLGKEFKIIAHDFNYLKEKDALIWVAAKPINRKIVKGPELKMKGHVSRFKKMHKKTFSSKGRIYAEIKTSVDLKEFVHKYKKTYKKKIAEMDVSDIRIKSNKTH